MLAGRFEIRNEGNVYVKRVFLADLVPDLTYRLYIGLAFNISRRAAEMKVERVSYDVMTPSAAVFLPTVYMNFFISSVICGII